MPLPQRGSLPERFPSPFAVARVHPLARRAAEELQRELAAGRPLAPSTFEEPHRGKMFGVLVVEDRAGRIGYLRGFSGMLGGAWLMEGFVGPAFDLEARTSFWPTGEAELLEYDRRLAELADAAQVVTRNLEAQATVHATARAELSLRHASRRERRHAERAAWAAGAGRGASGPSEANADLGSLVGESRADTAELRRLRQAQRVEREARAAPLPILEAERRALRAAQAARSNELLLRVHAGYDLRNFRGVGRPLRALFAPHAPPGGAGDCAAPKLLVEATRLDLRPVALAEFWWGAPPATGGRHHATYYPSCRGKCGPVLAHLLDGIDCDPLPVFGGDQAIPADQPVALYEDRWLVVVSKPAGLLSVPGRHTALTDAVSTRLRARYPEAGGPMLVHRLDLDTSGVMLVAKDRATYVALQRQFLERSIEKRYAAWLSWRPGPEREGRTCGVITLPLRTDLEDRPRQIVDMVAGKEARTEWRTDPRYADSRRVLLFPRTGRTHQLRVHAAHPLGLGAPILGDRLYGRGRAVPAEDLQPEWSPPFDERLLLHAEWLAFTHPHTGRRVEVESPAPF